MGMCYPEGVNEMQGFLNQEDSEKIAPYLDIPEGWSWWWNGHFLWCKNHGFFHSVFSDAKLRKEDFWEQGARLIPALNSEILNQFDLYDHEITINVLGYGVIVNVNNNFFEKSELQNRRDAWMFLIDEGLVKPVKDKTK